jgi:peptidylprolyl isomerase
MARGEPENSANSQFFLMRQPYPSLEKRYTVWGRVVVGLDVVRAVAIGEPPENPDKMNRVRMMSDIPEADRPRLQIADTRSPVFRARVDAARKAKGADFSVCDIDIPTKAG